MTATLDGSRDVIRAVEELAERLPDSIEALASLAYNYRWTWLPDGEAVFRDLDPALWRRLGANPRALIEAQPPHRLRERSIDPAFAGRVIQLAANVDADLARPPLNTPFGPDRPVAYFCSEFGLHASLPLYGGGLGVLAGDVLKAASDIALPMVGVGLLYRQGYFHQRLDLSGWQQEYWTTTEFERLPIVRVTRDGEPLAVTVPVRGRTVHVQVWRADIGRVPLYLLDTDSDDNHPIDRWITARLYIGDRHTRLAQYAILGIGGTRALAAMGIEPSVVHLNEGHAGLSSYERVRARMAQGEGFERALAAVRQATVFTTHTPVAAGNEWYAPEEIAPVLSSYIDTLGVPPAKLLDLGRVQPGEGREPLNITPLALRTSRAAIGVSRRHGEVARAMWHALWPERAVDAVPIGHVTNGVHTTTWMAPAMQVLLDRHLGAGWRRRLDDPALWDRVADIPDVALWQVRRTLRETLVRYARETAVPQRLARCEPREYVEGAAGLFAPDVLTIGFARRVATYKRLALVIRQLDRGLRLLRNAALPIQLVIAGKAHPSDDEAKGTLRDVLATRRAPGVGERIVFLEDYDLAMAPCIVAGVDLWVNLPRPPVEASGTSGMKVVLNGGLNLSVLDGWWIEGYDGETGWAIDTPVADSHVQDDHDATALFDLLEHEIVPLFYERQDGVPARWLARVKASMGRLLPRFSAERMVRDYVSTLYAPPGS